MPAMQAHNAALDRESYHPVMLMLCLLRVSRGTSGRGGSLSHSPISVFPACLLVCCQYPCAGS